MTKITVKVDGTSYTDEVEPRTLLVHYLREQLGKTGTVVGAVGGAAAGAAIANETANRDIIVTAGKNMTITLRDDFSRN